MHVLSSTIITVTNINHGVEYCEQRTTSRLLPTLQGKCSTVSQWYTPTHSLQRRPPEGLVLTSKINRSVGWNMNTTSTAITEHCFISFSNCLHQSTSKRSFCSQQLKLITIGKTLPTLTGKTDIQCSLLGVIHLWHLQENRFFLPPIFLSPHASHESDPSPL